MKTADRINERNASIDIFRYLCAIMVVAIHTGPLKEFSIKLGYIATEILPRIGVPFFFIVSGYYYFQKMQTGKNAFKNYFKHIIMVYSIWSVLYFLIDYIQWGYLTTKGFIVNCIISFVYYGSSYHFWFFPALIFALCFTTLLWRIGQKRIMLPLSIILYIVGVLGCAYYHLCLNIPVLGQFYVSPQFTNIRRILLMGFPFFSGGYLVNIIKDRFSKQKGLRLWAVSLIIWILEIVIIVNKQCQQNIVLTFGLYPLVITTLIILLQNPCPGLQEDGTRCKTIATFTYYAHPIIILVIRQMYAEIPNTVLFLLTSFFTLVLGLLLFKVNNSTIKKLVS